MKPVTFPIFALLLMALLILPACTPEKASERLGQARHIVEVADQTIEQAQARKDDLVQLTMVLPEGMAEGLTREIERLDQLIDETAQYREQALETIREIEQATAGATDWGQIVGGVGGAVVPFIPPPWNAVAGGVLAIAASLLGWRKGKSKGDENAIQIAASVEAARKENAELDAALKASALTLMKNQTDEQILLVDRAQRKL